MAVSSSDVSGSAGNSPGDAFLPVQDTHVFRLLQTRVQALEASLELTRQVALASCPREALESLESRLNMLELRLNASHDVSAGAIVSHQVQALRICLFIVAAWLPQVSWKCTRWDRCCIRCPWM